LLHQNETATDATWPRNDIMLSLRHRTFD